MLTLISIAFIVGILLGGYADFELGEWLTWLGFGLIAASAALGIGALALRHRGWGALTLVLALALTGGFIRVASVDSDPRADWNGVPTDGATITAQGVLLRDATRASDNDFLIWLSVDRVAGASADSAQFEDANFLMLVYSDGISADSGRAFDAFRYGDRYEVTGRFGATSAETDFAGSLNAPAARLISANEGNFIRRNLAIARDAISQQITTIFPDRIGGLAAAMTVGERKRLDADLTAAFRSAGLAHLLAISGFHLSLIGGVVLGLAILIFGRRYGLYIAFTLFVIWTYAALAGFSPSVIRAAIMFSVFLFARLLGRQNNILPSISVAAVVMTLVSPEIIASVSFQLSFSAILGIALLTTRINRLWNGTIRQETLQKNPLLRLVNYVVLGLAASLGATLFVTPIVISVFGETALGGPLTTLLAAPLLPFFIFPALVATALSWIWSPLGSVVAFPAVLSGEYISAVAEFFGGVSWLRVSYEELPLYIALVWYAALGMIVFQRPLRRLARVAFADGGAHFQKTPVLVALAIAVIGVWGLTAQAQSENFVKVHFPLTSIGDLIVIETPSGFQMVIDGARQRDEAVAALEEFLPFWDNSIDMIVLTHHDADHIGGLSAVIDRFNVGYILDSNAEHNDTQLARDWDSKLEAVAQQGDITVQKAVDGLTIDAGDGVVFEVIWSGVTGSGADINDFSTVIRMTYGDFSALFTGDITVAVEDLLAATEPELQSNLLKVAHHGSDSSSSATFLSAVRPSVAVIQAGVNNRFGHPDEEVVERLRNQLPAPNPAAPNLLIAEEVGDVTVYSNGANIIVELENSQVSAAAS